MVLDIVHTIDVLSQTEPGVILVAVIKGSDFGAAFSCIKTEIAVRGTHIGERQSGHIIWHIEFSPKVARII
jgi:hypothetical protein